eukprot:1160038-Pelagomonas_calceolata.AAC.6
MSSFRADGRLAGSGPNLPAKLVANVSTAPATASYTPTDTAGLPSSFVWRVAKVSGRGVPWAGLGSLA